jgi:hypothetical protein
MSNTIVWALLTGLITCGVGLGIVLLPDRRRRAMEIAGLRRRVEELEHAQGRVVELERALENLERRLPADNQRLV